MTRNNPEKGSTIKVEPFRYKKDIKLLKSYLQNKVFDTCLFAIGINTNLRASDILNLKVGQVKNFPVPKSAVEMPEVHIREKKTKKLRRISLNSESVQAINDLLKSSRGGPEKDDDAFLFKSIRRSSPISTSSFHRKVKTWARECNIKGNYGTHSLRKTFGYHQRKNGVDIPTLMVMFNHRSQQQTLDYLCIQPEEIKNVYWNGL